MQAKALQGERVLVLEDEPLIAFDIQETLAGEGAAVLLAPTIPEALQCADQPALSAGVLDVRVGCVDAEPVCEALRRRRVPFVFFTGIPERSLSRWPAVPVVHKPASAAAIIGALKFALSVDGGEVVLGSLGAGEGKGRASIDEVIAKGEERILRVRRAIATLQAAGFDASAGEDVLATMTNILENLRVHRRISTSSGWGR